mgnify:CR=1 FL=1
MKEEKIAKRLKFEIRRKRQVYIDEIRVISCTPVRSSKTFQDRTEDEQQDNRMETRVEVRKTSSSFSLLS